MAKVLKEKLQRKTLAKTDPVPPLECRKFNGRSELGFSTENGDGWVVVAKVYSCNGIRHEVVAPLLCQSLTKSFEHRNILNDAMNALEQCLAEASMTFSTEQAAECVINRIKRVIP